MERHLFKMDRVKIRCYIIINRLYIASNAIIDARNVKYMEFLSDLTDIMLCRTNERMGP